MPHQKLTSIFISYRRDDTDAIAENIYHHLQNAFGEVVFKDNMRIGPSEKWDKEIRSNLQQATVVLTPIGEKWFAHDEHHRPRLYNKEDWVRMEIEDSLKHDKPIIPLFIDGVKPPTKESFDHPNLTVLQEKFPFQQGISISSRDLLRDLHKLIYTDLPGLGIPLLKNENRNAKAIDILADYPLPLKPDPKRLPPPYVGLRPFNAGESFLFFGRDQDILKIIKKLESPDPDKKIILYHGRSGVGKSSLLSAGLYLRMKHKGWEVPLPLRRKKEKGLAKDLQELMDSNYAPYLKHLFVLDQVEEIFTNPQPEKEQEIADLQAALLQFRADCNNARLLLSFRSDYFTEVRKILEDASIPWDEMELFPLDGEGVLKAITGVTDRSDLQELYRLRFDPPDLPQEIRVDILKDKNSSHITPLLQYQLEELFRLAAPPDWKDFDNKPPVTITEEHYSADFRKDNLDRMLDAEFEYLHKDSPKHTASGLALDVLYQFITDQATAATLSDAEVLTQYEHIPDFSTFFDYLKNRRSLLIGNKNDDNDEPRTRLAHDSLAPLLLARFRDSDAPGQRAWQILEPKLKDLKKDLKPTLLSTEDLKIVEEGKPGMRHVPMLEGLLRESEQVQQQREAELRNKNAYIFDSFADVGIDLIYTLDHQEALEKLKVATEVEIDFKVKQQKLQPPLEELLFFFAEGGLHLEQARTAAKLLLQLQPENDLAPDLRRCLHESWKTRRQFAPLLQKLPSFSLLQARYYPEMIALPEGTFTMGSATEEIGHKSDELQHEVSLSAFQLAATPVTFYQYALYCEAQGKSLLSRTPFWGRFGDHPLVNINWYDTIEFCNWLSVHQGLIPCYEINKQTNSDDNDNKVPSDYLKWRVIRIENATGFRLPTEAEWEYAARGAAKKQQFRFAGSDTLEEVAWFWENSGDQALSGEWDMAKLMDNNCRTHPVKSKKDNGIGLYDMSGNVYEWCWDWYQQNYYEQCQKEGIVPNPTGSGGSSKGRVLRGGSWNNDDDYCRVAFRLRVNPFSVINSYGFRLALD